MKATRKSMHLLFDLCDQVILDTESLAKSYKPHSPAHWPNTGFATPHWPSYTYVVQTGTALFLGFCLHQSEGGWGSTGPTAFRVWQSLGSFGLGHIHWAFLLFFSYSPTTASLYPFFFFFFLISRNWTQIFCTELHPQLFFILRQDLRLALNLWSVLMLQPPKILES